VHVVSEMLSSLEFKCQSHSPLYYVKDMPTYVYNAMILSYQIFVLR